MKIKIIATPPGEAPEHIRKQWIGCEMKLHHEDETGVTIGVTSGQLVENGNSFGYVFTFENCVQALLAKGKTETADWWMFNGSGSQLVFGKEFCEVIE